MGEPGSTVGARWQLRTVPEDRARRYRDEGWWTDQTLGEMVARGLGRIGDHATFRVRSVGAPVAGYLRRGRPVGAGPGRCAARPTGSDRATCVVFQLPNWVEAGITFWAAAYLGAVVVPIVHFYGAKEVDYILRTVSPAVVVTADRFGHNDYLATYRRTPSRPPRGPVAGGRGVERPAASHRVPCPSSRISDADRSAGPVPVDPDAPAIIGFTSGTTRDPKGVVHSHRTIGCETRQLNYMFPTGGPPQITGAPVGHFIGMLNAFLVPLLRDAVGRT